MENVKTDLALLEQRSPSPHLDGECEDRPGPAGAEARAKILTSMETAKTDLALLGKSARRFSARWRTLKTDLALLEQRSQILSSMENAKTDWPCWSRSVPWVSPQWRMYQTLPCWSRGAPRFSHPQNRKRDIALLVERDRPFRLRYRQWLAAVGWQTGQPLASAVDLQLLEQKHYPDSHLDGLGEIDIALPEDEAHADYYVPSESPF